MRKSAAVVVIYNQKKLIDKQYCVIKLNDFIIII